MEPTTREKDLAWVTEDGLNLGRAVMK